MTDWFTSDDEVAGDPSEQSTSLTYEIGNDESPSMAVVRAVSALTDTPPLELKPFYDVVPPRHLESLIQGTSDDMIGVTISLTYNGSDVTVTPTEVDVLVCAGDT